MAQLHLKAAARRVLFFHFKTQGDKGGGSVWWGVGGGGEENLEFNDCRASQMPKLKISCLEEASLSDG